MHLSLAVFTLALFILTLLVQRQHRRQVRANSAYRLKSDSYVSMPEPAAIAHGIWKSRRAPERGSMNKCSPP